MERRLYLIFALCVLAHAEDTTDRRIIDWNPESVLSVKYGDNKVDYGNELRPVQVKDIPEVEWAAQEDTYYTLAMVDPDAPSRSEPLYREFLHWLVANIPGNDISKGETIAEYVGSGPPKGTGLHRYVFLIFKQPSLVDLDNEPRTTRTSRKNRKSFKIDNFVKKYHMEPVPIAGNYYQAQYDDYVPTIHQQLSRDK